MSFFVFHNERVGPLFKFKTIKAIGSAPYDTYGSCTILKEMRADSGKVSAGFIKKTTEINIFPGDRFDYVMHFRNPVETLHFKFHGDEETVIVKL